jgi:hypothetical protein
LSGRRINEDGQGIEDLPNSLLAVRHIGPRRARRLIDALGSDWKLLLDRAPERVFGTLRGVGSRQARIAAESWRRVSVERHAQRGLRSGALGQ